MAFQPSSNARKGAGTPPGSRCDARRPRFAGWLLAAAGLLGSSGCATVKPQDKELLADPAMTYGAGGTADVHEQHVLENREGAAGAGAASGGGCGCN